MADEKIKVEEKVIEKTEKEIAKDISEEVKKEQKAEEKKVEADIKEGKEEKIEDVEKKIAKDVAKESEKEQKAEEKKVEADIKKGEKELEEVSESEKEEIPERKRPGMREKRDPKEDLENWIPKTRLGKEAKDGKIKDIDYILDKNFKILEPEVVDQLLNLESDILFIGQAKGKFGGGKRRAWRQTQKKTSEGNIPTFSAMAVVGDGNGHVGIGYGRAKETLPARGKAVRKAKLNLIKVRRSCGSFDCSCKEKHSIPFKVEGKCGSSKIILLPAPQGTGLVVGDEMKKILKLAGITDAYSKTFGRTRTTFNLAKACIEALKKTNSK